MDISELSIKERLVLSFCGVVAGISGAALIWYHASGWVALGVFLALWSYNIAEKNKGA